jgi:acetyltransferase-like isoleucine patch superfamily enzyme
VEVSGRGIVTRLRDARRVAGRAKMLLREEPPYSALRVGRHSYGGHVLTFPGSPQFEVTVGAFCSIAPEVEFMASGGGHKPDWITTYPLRWGLGISGSSFTGVSRRGGITVGNDVWIGWGATILPGVTIGDGAVVGARSVVTRDVRPYAVVAGNPARELRRRFSDEQVEQLLEIAWWTWPDEELAQIVPLLHQPDVAALCEYAARRPSAGRRDQDTPVRGA